MATEQRAGGVVTRHRPNATVSVGTDGLDSAAIEREFETSFAFNDDLLAQGTERWDGRYRWVGPVKFLAYKEVGPPPWRWPKVGVQPSGWTFVRFIVGWRSTAYALCIKWAGRRPSSRGRDTFSRSAAAETVVDGPEMSVGRGVAPSVPADGNTHREQTDAGER